MNEPRSDEEWVDFYADQHGIYRAFVGKLEDLLRDLLYEADIAPAWVLQFSEDADDFALALNRARRAGQTFDNPLESSLRAAGVTIAVESPMHAPQVGDLIRREFVVDPAGSLSIDEAVARNELLAGPEGSRSAEPAYEFPYYLVSLDERRLDLDEWGRFAGLKVRLEVKTELQDAWQDVADNFPFAEAASYPAEVRDILARSAVAMAAIEDDLVEARNTLSRLDAEFEDAVAAGDLQLPLNGVTLLAYVRSSDLVRSLTELSIDIGFGVTEYEPSWRRVESGLLWLLRSDEAHTLAELEEFLEQARPRARSTFTALLELVSDAGISLWAVPSDLVEWLWVILGRADAETIALLPYRDEIGHALNTLIGNPVSADDHE